MNDTTDVGTHDRTVEDRRQRFLGKTCPVTGGNWDWQPHRRSRARAQEWSSSRATPTN